MSAIKTETQLKSLCRSFTEDNVKTLSGWATGANIDPELKMRAITMLMDRGWGKPHQAVTQEVKGEVRVILREMLTDEDE